MPVPVAKLADEFGIERSQARKYLLNNGYQFLRMRSREYRGQEIIALSDEDAESARQLRLSQGYSPLTDDLVMIGVDDAKGLFYVIQLIPELDPRRIKMGYSAGLPSRMLSYRTTSPSATLLASWPCRKTWEPAALACLSRNGCALIGQELFVCDDIQALKDQGDTFFSMMPSP